jgi:hypothetical protein
MKKLLLLPADDYVNISDNFLPTTAAMTDLAAAGNRFAKSGSMAAGTHDQIDGCVVEPSGIDIFASVRDRDWVRTSGSVRDRD